MRYNVLHVLYSVLTEPAVQPQAILCFQRVLPCSLVTTPHQAGQLTPEIQPPFHWWNFTFTFTLICKSPARFLLLFTFARNEPRDGGQLGRLTLQSPNSHFLNKASLNLTLCSLSVLSILPFTEPLESVSAAEEHTGKPVLAPQTRCAVTPVPCVSLLQLCQQHPVAGAWTAEAERRCRSCLPTLGASWPHQCLPEACPMVRTAQQACCECLHCHTHKYRPPKS